MSRGDGVTALLALWPMSRGDVSHRRHTITPLCTVSSFLGLPVRSGVASLANEPWHRWPILIGTVSRIDASWAVAWCRTVGQ